jgi:methenyltetrahydromethanopterin cyclohydrolase
MVEIDFDVEVILSGSGTCPLASIAADDLEAIGRTNDAVLYGGRAWYTTKTDDAHIEEVIDRLPSSASSDYGTPFIELFRRYDGDFYKIDPLLFSPAEVFVNNVTSGRTFHAGGLNADMIRRVLLS